MGQSLCIYFHGSDFQSSVCGMVSFRSLWKGLECGGAGAQVISPGDHCHLHSFGSVSPALAGWHEVRDGSR